MATIVPLYDEPYEVDDAWVSMRCMIEISRAVKLSPDQVCTPGEIQRVLWETWLEAVHSVCQEFPYLHIVNIHQDPADIEPCEVKDGYRNQPPG